MDDQRIGPTAHYTGEVWRRHGLSPDALGSRLGRVLYRAMQPLEIAYRRRGHRSVEHMLVARHRLLDERLRLAIDSGRVAQVLELAAGFSPRGLRFGLEYEDRDLVYVESDLLVMADEKRRRLDAHGGRAARHHVIPLDVRKGPRAMAEALDGWFDHDRGTAIVCEGLLPYLDEPSRARLLSGIAAQLRRFAHGVFLTDLNLSGDVRSRRASGALRSVLRVATGRGVTLPFRTADDAVEATLGAGFERARVFDAPGDEPLQGRPPVVRVLEGTVGGRLS